MIKFKIYTLGCKVNQYDSSELRRRLNSAGFKLVNRNAEVVIINTCSVTKTAIHKNKRMINKASKESPRAKIVVIGCWPKVYKDDAKKLNVDLIWQVGKFNDLIKKIKDLFKNNKVVKEKELSSGLFRQSTSEVGCPELSSFKSRYFLKIQDGYDQFCSYCIIPYARGELNNRPQDEVVKEIKQAVDSGYKEIVLCGIHLGLYEIKNTRKPVGTPAPLVELLKKLININNLGRIRLSSIEVTEVNDELIRLMAGAKKICQHLHIPLQSGNNKILKLMNRPYDLNYFKNKINKIRKIMPDIAISTDVIVGFPGETKKDFNMTYNFIKDIKFSRLHVFPFSAHGRTPASKMPGRVKKDEMESRAKNLRKLGEKLEQEYKEKFIGQTLEIIIENLKDEKLKGKAEYYFDLELNLKNTIQNHKKTKNYNNLIGKMINIKYMK